VDRPRIEARADQKQLVPQPSGRADLERLSTPQLIARLAQDAQNLVKAEIELGKSELRAGLAGVVATLRRLVVGVVLALMACSVFAAGAVLALSLVLPAWAAAFIVGGVLALASLVAFALVRRRVVAAPSLTNGAQEPFSK
jgi:hypothetical protein